MTNYFIVKIHTFFGAGDWTWTSDLLITNQLLYQLSYASIIFMERETGLEPATYSLEGCHSTNWAIPAYFDFLISIWNLSTRPLRASIEANGGDIVTTHSLGIAVQPTFIHAYRLGKLRRTTFANHSSQKLAVPTVAVFTLQSLTP
jgi:hypothetical protein